MNNKKENFKRIAESRTNKIIDMITLLGNLSNSSFYEYTQEQIDKIFGEIQNELDKQRSKFNKDSNSNKKRFEL